MKIMIGRRIKTLRKKHDMTQERLAEYLGITSQAISRWESETCYPDIELLPALADVFGVTVDEMLCVDLQKKDAKIQSHIASAHAMQNEGRFDEAVSYLRTALSEFPSSFLLQVELACAIGAIDNGKKVSCELCDEAIRLCCRILENCLDDALRMRAKTIQCFVYSRHLGDVESAMKIADTLPDLLNVRGVVMAEVLKILPPHPLANAFICEAIVHMLLLFGNPMAYQIKQQPQKCLEVLIKELQNFQDIACVQLE